jgi:hypothetical protein
VTGQYSKLETPEAQLEYLLLFVCRSRSRSSQVSATLPNAVQMPVPPTLVSEPPGIPLSAKVTSPIEETALRDGKAVGVNHMTAVQARQLHLG